MKKGIISVVSTLAGISLGAVAAGKLFLDRIENIQVLSDKHLSLFLMMNQWVKVKQEGKKLASYFEKNGYKKIAVYGMSYVGETLLEELEGTAIEVAYAIDKKADSVYANVDVFSLEAELIHVDVVVVTAVTYFDEIEEQLNKKMNCPIISLENILYEM